MNYNNIYIMVRSLARDGAYGCKICVSDYCEYDQLEERLIAEGFEPYGADSGMLYVEYLKWSDYSWTLSLRHHYTPFEVFTTLQDSGVLDDTTNLTTVAQAYIEVFGFASFVDLVNNLGSHWDYHMHYYECWDWEDYGRQLYELRHEHIDEDTERFFDFAAYALDNSENIHRVNGGLLEVFN